jgi:general stress protein 26
LLVSRIIDQEEHAMEPSNEPKVGRPKMPDGYGVPEHNNTVLPWSYVEERMQAARNYWVVTASQGGRPAATPVWGAWIAGKLYFDGAPTTRRGRNITQNPRVVVHLESGDEVLILEGTAEILSGAPDRALAEQVAAAYTKKYAPAYEPSPDQWDAGGLFIFTPQLGLGWTIFPENMTRWEVT